MAANNSHTVRKLNIIFGVPSCSRNKNCVDVTATAVVRTATLRRNQVRTNKYTPRTVASPRTIDGSLILMVETPKAMKLRRCRM